VRGSEERGYWRRPGKDGPGWSATTGRKSESGRELFCVFSSNAHPFPGPSAGRACSNHDRFGIYALLCHGGDFAAATRALAERGFGGRTRRRVPGKAALAGIPLGPLTLSPGQSRRPPTGKLTVTVGAFRDGKKVDEFPLTPAESSRRAAARILAVHVGDEL